MPGTARIMDIIKMRIQEKCTTMEQAIGWLTVSWVASLSLQVCSGVPYSSILQYDCTRSLREPNIFIASGAEGGLSELGSDLSHVWGTEVYLVFFEGRTVSPPYSVVLNRSYRDLSTNTKCCSISLPADLCRTPTVMVLLPSDSDRTFLPSLNCAPRFILQSVISLLSSQTVLEEISVSFMRVRFSAPSVVSCHTRVCSPSAFFQT
jgi:hypothetical protein